MTIGIVSVPPLVVNVVAADILIPADVVLLFEIEIVKPVTCPVIVPIETGICVIPL